MELFKYLGTSLTNQNDIYEKVYRRMKSGNDCYQSMHYLMCLSLISKNIKIKIHRITTVPVV